MESADDLPAWGGAAGFDRFDGSLPPGVSFDSTRGQVESGWEVPERSAEPAKTLLGAHGGWVRDQLPVGLVHFQFRAAGPGIALITLMTPRDTP